MEINGFIKTVIGIIALLLVTVLVAIPIITSATQSATQWEAETIYNDSDYRLEEYDSAVVPSFTIVVDLSGQTITMNDEEIETSEHDSGIRFIVLYENEYGITAFSVSNDYEVYGSGGSGPSITQATLTWNAETKMMTCSYIPNTSSTSTIDIAKIIMPDSDGSLGVFYDQYWGTKGDDVYFVFDHRSESLTFNRVVSTTNAETITINLGFIKFSVTASESMGDAYRYDPSQGSFESSGGYSYGYVIGSSEAISGYTAIDNPALDLINIIPLLLIIGFILAVVGSFIYYRTGGLG